MGQRDEPVEDIPQFCPYGGCFLWWQDHGFSMVLLKCLRAIYQAHETRFGRTRDAVALMGNSFKGNYLKLEYWGLAMWARDDRGAKIQGMLRCTTDGERFLKGTLAIHKTAVTRKVCGPDAVEVRLEGPLIYAHDIDATCWAREDYLAHRRPLGDAP